MITKMTTPQVDAAYILAAPTPVLVKAKTQKTPVAFSSKPVAKTARKAPVVKPAAVVKPAEPAKPRKPKLVRDSFTMPKDEYLAIDALKLRAGKLGRSVKKSELLRAGIKALSALSDIQFQAALSEVPTIKTGRPKDVK